MLLDVSLFNVAVQICDNVKNDGWSVTKDPKGRVGPYASKHDQWVSYDDVSNVARKVCLRRMRITYYTRSDIYNVSSV